MLSGQDPDDLAPKLQWQAPLAARARIPQSSISVIETGRRTPTIELIDRLLASVGQHLARLPTRTPTVAESADEIRDLLREVHSGRLFRSLIQISNNVAAADPPIRAALAVTPPPLTGHADADAFIAALVDWRLHDDDLPCPDWVNDPARILRTEWVADGHPESADLIRSDSPNAVSPARRGHQGRVGSHDPHHEVASIETRARPRGHHRAPVCNMTSGSEAEAVLDTFSMGEEEIPERCYLLLERAFSQIEIVNSDPPYTLPAMVRSDGAHRPSS